MVSVGASASGRRFRRSVSRSACVFALLVTACTADGTAICERLAECELLPENYSKGRCEHQLEGEDDLESCRSCVEETSCKDIVKECKAECLLD